MNIGSSLTLLKENDSYLCKIIDKDETYLYVDFPFNKKTGKTVFLRKYTCLQASFIDQLDQQTNVYQFETKVVDYIRGIVPSIAILRPEEGKIKKIQRREFVRIPAVLDVTILDEANDKNKFQTVSSDISGGGISVVAPPNLNLKEEEKYPIEIDLPMKDKIDHSICVTGQVVRLSERNNIQLVSIKFIDINKKNEQQIVRFCFEKQREERQINLK